MKRGSRTVERRGAGLRRLGLALPLAAVALAVGSHAGLDSRGPAPPVFQAKLPPETPREVEFHDAPAVVEPGSEAALPPLGGLPRDADAPPPAAAAPWRDNAVPFLDRPGLKLIAVIIDDAGLDRARTSRATQLPGPLPISFLPYAGDLRRQASEARRAGHELMLHLPMEPISASEDPGPHPLMTWLARGELERRLAMMLTRFDGFVGVNNHMGSRMTLDLGAMLPVLEEIRGRGLLFVDSRTVAGSVAGPLADRLGIPGAARDVFIDHDGSAEAVAARLADIERIALRLGRAVAIGHPHDLTLGALERWLPTLAERGFTLAPVSALAKRREATRQRHGPAPTRATLPTTVPSGG
ncbi:MAG: divergent polysaccharide deacetylase family protein [Rhodospirillales bacterium]